MLNTVPCFRLPESARPVCESVRCVSTNKRKPFTFRPGIWMERSRTNQQGLSMVMSVTDLRLCALRPVGPMLLLPSGISVLPNTSTATASSLLKAGIVPQCSIPSKQTVGFASSLNPGSSSAAFSSLPVALDSGRSASTLSLSCWLCLQVVPAGCYFEAESM